MHRKYKYRWWYFPKSNLVQVTFLLWEKSKVWVPLESSQVVTTQPKIPLFKASYQQLCDSGKTLPVALCQNCPGCNGSVTGATIIFPQKLLLSETWQPPKFWTLTQTVSDIKSPLCVPFYITVQIKLEPTLCLAKGNCIMVLSALKNYSASKFICTDYS